MVPSEEDSHGLAPAIELECTECGSISSEVLAEKQVTGKSRFYNVNRKAVLAMRMIGRGYQGLKTLCSILDLPQPMSKRSFDGHRKTIFRASKTVAEQSMCKASETVLGQQHAEEFPDRVAVSTDGTWMW